MGEHESDLLYGVGHVNWLRNNPVTPLAKHFAAKEEAARGVD